MMDFYSFNFKIVGVLDGCLKRNYLLKLAGGMVQIFFFLLKIRSLLPIITIHYKSRLN